MNKIRIFFGSFSPLQWAIVLSVTSVATFIVASVQALATTEINGPFNRDFPWITGVMALIFPFVTVSMMIITGHRWRHAGQVGLLMLAATVGVATFVVYRYVSVAVESYVVTVDGDKITSLQYTGGIVPRSTPRQEVRIYPWKTFRDPIEIKKDTTICGSVYNVVILAKPRMDVPEDIELYDKFAFGDNFINLLGKTGKEIDDAFSEVDEGLRLEKIKSLKGRVEGYHYPFWKMDLDICIKPTNNA